MVMTGRRPMNSGIRPNFSRSSGMTSPIDVAERPSWRVQLGAEAQALACRCATR